MCEMSTVYVSLPMKGVCCSPKEGRRKGGGGRKRVEGWEGWMKGKAIGGEEERGEKGGR